MRHTTKLRALIVAGALAFTAGCSSLPIDEIASTEPPPASEPTVTEPKATQPPATETPTTFEEISQQEINKLAASITVNAMEGAELVEICGAMLVLDRTEAINALMSGMDGDPGDYDLSAEIYNQLLVRCN